MRPAAALLLAALAAPAAAHRLDETLQATLVDLQPGQVSATTRIVPGQQLAESAIAQIDTDGDGIFSPAEQRAFAQRALQDMAFTLDGRATVPRLVAWSFPAPALVRAGQGEIRIDYTLPGSTAAGDHVLTLASRPGADTVLLVNAAAPTAGDLAVTGQKRDKSQTAYELDFRVGAGAGASPAVRLPVDPVVAAIARQAPWMAGALLALMLVLLWRQRRGRPLAGAHRRG